MLLLSGGNLVAQQGPSPWFTYDPSGRAAYSAPRPPSQPYNYPQQGYTEQAYSYPQSNPELGPQQPQGFNAEQLETMVAPIALYPDNLVSIVLAASTYPAQVTAADQWLRTLGDVSAEQVAAGADAQTSWDPSVKALTAFPQVLDQLARNLPWTTDLGNAYYNQAQDVMQAIQVLRGRAQAAGNLQNTPQEQVSVEQGNIELAPPDQQTVYVPNYNPWTVYGQPVSPYPGFSLLNAVSSFLGSSPVQWGLGIAMNAFMHTPWGWLGWGLDWLAHSILFNHNDYSTQSMEVRDWGFPNGGPRAFRSGLGRAGYHDGRSWSHSRSEFNREQDRAYRGYGSNTFGRNGMPQQAYNRLPQPAGRSPQYDGRQYQHGGSFSYSGRSEPSRQNYGAGYASSYRSDAYRQPLPAYRSNSASFNPEYRSSMSGYRGEQGSRSYNAYGGVANQNKRGGFHLFGGHHESNSSNYGGGYKTPKGWGGSEHGGGSYKAPKASHFGGGGHFHSGGGGHSSGKHGRRH